MEWLLDVIDLFQHVDIYIYNLLRHYGNLTYILLFLIIFSETGFVVLSFLPGDALLLVVGAVCASGGLDIWIVIPLLLMASVTGNMLNYWLGSKIGPRIFKRPDGKFFKVQNLEKAHRFFQKNGGVTLIISRFFAVIRAFAPFIAGIAKMDFGKFMVYNLIGGTGWVILFSLIGFFFGKIPGLHENSFLTMLILVILSLLIIPFILRSVLKKYHDEAPVK
jgi:membrane-associated protein